MIERTFAVLVCLAGCGDKKAAPATAVAVPPGSGIALREDHGGTIVTDTIAKYEINVPGPVSKIESSPGGSRPSVTLYHDLAHGFEMVAIAPAQTTDVAAYYAGIAASINGTNIDGAIAKDIAATDVTIAGHPGRRFDARLDAGKHQGHLCQVVVVIPDKQVAYSFTIVDGDAAAITDPVPLFSSLQPATR